MQWGIGPGQIHWVHFLGARGRVRLHGGSARFGIRGVFMHIGEGKWGGRRNIQCGRCPIPIGRQGTIGIIVLVRRKVAVGPGARELL